MWSGTTWFLASCIRKSLVKNLDLDRALGGIHSNVKGFYSFLQLEAVGDQRLDVDEAFGNETDSFRVLLSA